MLRSCLILPCVWSLMVLDIWESSGLADNATELFLCFAVPLIQNLQTRILIPTPFSPLQWGPPTKPLTDSTEQKKERMTDWVTPSYLGAFSPNLMNCSIGPNCFAWVWCWLCQFDYAYRLKPCYIHWFCITRSYNDRIKVIRYHLGLPRFEPEHSKIHWI